MSRGRAWPAPDNHCATALLLLLLLLGVAVGGCGSGAAAKVDEREEAGFTDGLQQGVDLISGYYDAGDHVKFSLPRSSEACAPWLEMSAAGSSEAGVQATLGSDNPARGSVKIAI